MVTDHSNCSSWLTVNEAVAFHHQNTPRKRPIHRSAVYRWIRSGKVIGERCGGSLYICRQSLASFCEGRPALQRQEIHPADERRAEAAVQRMRAKYGLGGGHHG